MNWRKNNMKQNYRTWKKSELKEEIIKLTIKIMESYGMKQDVKKTYRPQLRREIARIKTILNEKKNKNKNNSP